MLFVMFVALALGVLRIFVSMAEQSFLMARTHDQDYSTYFEDEQNVKFLYIYLSNTLTHPSSRERYCTEFNCNLVPPNAF